MDVGWVNTTHNGRSHLGESTQTRDSKLPGAQKEHMVGANGGVSSGIGTAVAIDVELKQGDRIEARR